MDNNISSLIYSKGSQLYDLLYSYKDYKKESKDLENLIKKYKTATGNKLLDVGCGTGKHIQYLRNWYSCEGLDISQELISIARNRNKKATFHIADMTNFQLNASFDIIICLFGSIGYVESDDQFLQVLENFYKHLNDGGIVIIEPWFSKEDKDFKVDVPFMTIFEREKLKISRISIAKVKENFSFIDTHYLIGNGSVQYIKEQEKLMLITHSKFLESMGKVGFNARYLKKSLSNDDRGLYVGIK